MKCPFFWYTLHTDMINRKLDCDIVNFEKINQFSSPFFISKGLSLLIMIFSLSALIRRRRHHQYQKDKQKKYLGHSSNFSNKSLEYCANNEI